MKFAAAGTINREVSRPPRGGRGLKLKYDLLDRIREVVAPLAGGVD